MRDKYAKRLSEKSLLKAEDLEYIGDRIFQLNKAVERLTFMTTKRSKDSKGL